MDIPTINFFNGSEVKVVGLQTDDKYAGITSITNLQQICHCFVVVVLIWVYEACLDYIVVSLAFRLNISLGGLIICCPDEEQYFRLQSEMLSDVRCRQPCVSKRKQPGRWANKTCPGVKAKNKGQQGISFLTLRWCFLHIPNSNSVHRICPYCCDIFRVLRCLKRNTCADGISLLATIKVMNGLVNIFYD